MPPPPRPPRRAATSAAATATTSATRPHDRRTPRRTGHGFFSRRGTSTGNPLCPGCRREGEEPVGHVGREVPRAEIRSELRLPPSEAIGDDDPSRERIGIPRNPELHVRSVAAESDVVGCHVPEPFLADEARAPDDVLQTPSESPSSEARAAAAACSGRPRSSRTPRRPYRASSPSHRPSGRGRTPRAAFRRREAHGASRLGERPRCARGPDA